MWLACAIPGTPTLIQVSIAHYLVSIMHSFIGFHKPILLHNLVQLKTTRAGEKKEGIACNNLDLIGKFIVDGVAQNSDSGAED
jgi:hypothetical protein